MTDPTPTARDFYQAYLILAENNERVRKEIQSDNRFSISSRMMDRIQSGDLMQSLSAHIVCLAFAIELYLKAVLFHSVGQWKNTHNLHDLFGSVPEPIRNEIILGMQKSMPGMSAADFDTRLRNIAAAFDEWRYVFENGSAAFMPGFGLAFAEALAAAVDRLKASQLKTKP